LPVSNQLAVLSVALSGRALVGVLLVMAVSATSACNVRRGGGSTSSTTPTATSGGAGEQPGGIQAEHTGQEQPSLVMENDYPVTQYIFVDGELVGTVETGSSRTFDIGVGTHQIRSTDSEDPDDNPAVDSIEVEPGHRYSWRVYQTTVAQ